MTFQQIRDMPTTIGTGPGGPRYHESILRSYHALIKVQELCQKNCPNEVLWELIEDIRSLPQKDIEKSV